MSSSTSTAANLRHFRHSSPAKTFSAVKLKVHPRSCVHRPMRRAQVVYWPKMKTVALPAVYHVVRDALPEATVTYCFPSTS